MRATFQTFWRTRKFQPEDFFPYWFRMMSHHIKIHTHTRRAWGYPVMWRNGNCCRWHQLLRWQIRHLEPNAQMQINARDSHCDDGVIYGRAYLQCKVRSYSSTRFRSLDTKEDRGNFSWQNCCKRGLTTLKMIRQVLVFCGIILSDVTSAFGPTQRVAQRPVHQFCLSDSLTPELNTKSEQYELHSGNRDSLTSTASTRREIVAFLGSMMAFSSVLCGHPTSASATYTASSKSKLKTADVMLRTPSFSLSNTAFTNCVLF